LDFLVLKSLQVLSMGFLADQQVVLVLVLVLVLAQPHHPQ
jgi:hypothetical protein